MRIIPASTFKRSPWKNGGGITHEIARDTEGDDFGWRISVAEVNSDGPFSLFQNYQRCLTVISGNGMELQNPSGSISARLFEPVWFSGDETIFGKLIDGPCLDFNVIFNPKTFQAKVEVLTNADLPIRGNPDNVTALYQLDIQAPPKPQDFIVLETPDDAFILPKNSKAILLRLSAQPIRM